jgi:hypothetical protein
LPGLPANSLVILGKGAWSKTSRPWRASWDCRPVLFLGQVPDARVISAPSMCLP